MKEHDDLLLKLCKRIYDNIFKVGVASNLYDSGIEERDCSTLTVQEIVNKIKDFLKSDPSDEKHIIFLNYLAKYPVSMCKRDVSPLLKKLIGFHYRLGIPNKEQELNGAEKVSYDDLSEIFVRSKATISQCVNETEIEWKELQQEIEDAKRIEAEAKQQLIEEEKARLRQEEMEKQSNSRTNERTPSTTSEEDNSS